MNIKYRIIIFFHVATMWKCSAKLIAHAAILHNLLDLLNSAQVHCRSVNQMRVCNKYICFMFQIDIVYKYIGKRVKTVLKIKKMVKRMRLENFV